MTDRITDEMIDHVALLAKLELSASQRETAKKDMTEMLHYIDKLNELDTEGVGTASYVLPVWNVFREDVIENGDDSTEILRNAPGVKNGMFTVPRAVE